MALQSNLAAMDHRLLTPVIVEDKSDSDMPGLTHAAAELRRSGDENAT